MIMVIPEEKRIRAINMLKSLVDRKKATIKELQTLCGFLNFICKSVFPGRTFLRRMYSKFAHAVKILGNRPCKGMDQILLKQHYHVKLDCEFKMDCRI